MGKECDHRAEYQPLGSAGSNHQGTQAGGVPGEIEAISLAHRCVIFRFSDQNAMAMTLGWPWVVNGQPIATEAWRPDFVPATDSVPSALLWIRLPRLPMEYWKDIILQSIVQPAGVYQFADASTLTKMREGFSRVCVRIDLTKPLRPGARIRGSHSPFWQQFSYEHLEGFCANCGSLHYSNPCSPSPDEASPLLGSKYGPWMAAVRQLRPSSAPGIDARKKMKQTASPGGAASQSAPGKAGVSSASQDSAEGWRTPTKVARRRTMKMSAIISSAAHGDEGNPGSDGMPVTVDCAGLSQSSPEKQIELSLNLEKVHNQSKNPFSLLGSAKWAGRSKAQADACPGPSKRARPEENTTQREKSKNTKGKGKLNGSTPKSHQKLVSPTFDLDIPQETTIVFGMTPDSKGSTGTSPEQNMETPNVLSQVTRSSHELALSRLKGVIRG